MIRSRQRPAFSTDWELHKQCMRQLIVHMLLQAVRDAERLASGSNRKDGQKRGPALTDEWKRPSRIMQRRQRIAENKQHLQEFTDSMRFEFWTEFCDIPVDVAEAVIQKVADGEIKPDGLYRADKK